jgi:hypothetical protein
MSCGLVGRFQGFEETYFNPAYGDSMFSKTVVSTYESTWHHNADQQHCQVYESFKFSNTHPCMQNNKHTVSLCTHKKVCVCMHPCWFETSYFFRGETSFSSDKWNHYRVKILYKVGNITWMSLTS